MIEALVSRDLSAADFLDDWHGTPAARASDDDGLRVAVPDALRAFYGAVARQPDAIVQNRLIPPQELRPDGDRFVFYVEGEGVYEWATQAGEGDPPVYGRFNEPGEAWEQEREPLSRFLVQVAMFEAVMGAEHHASAAWLAADATEQVLSTLVELPYGAWRWPSDPTRFFGREDVLAVVAPNRTSYGEEHFSIDVGAKTPGTLGFLEPFIDDNWEHFSPAD
jgi:hypothetical protein